MNLDIDLLRAFVTIADIGNFTRAAERLGRTQSTISLQLKRLEDALGRRLFERNARNVRLTSDGEMLLSYARTILRTNDEVVSRITEPDLEGLVRLGTPEDFATSYLPAVLARFARAHPRIALDVRCDLTLNLLKWFENGDFDLVLVKREPQGSSGGVKVWREPLVWAAVDRSIVDPSQPVPLVVSPQPCVYRKRATHTLDRIGRAWRITYTSPSLAGAQAAVLAGLGVTVLPKDMVPQGMHVLGIDDGFPELDDTEIALCRAPQGISKAAERLAEHIIRSLEPGNVVRDRRRMFGNGTGADTQLLAPAAV